MKTKQIIFFVLVIGFLSSCDFKEKELLQSRVDSLQVELQTSQQMAYTVQEIGVLIDSIDASRQVLRTNVVEGTSYSDYNSRLADINNHSKDTQQKIAALESQLDKSKVNYSATIRRLKADLKASGEQLAALQKAVEDMRGENETLKLTINEKDVILAEQKEVIQLREEDVTKLTAQVEDITIASTKNKAELFFAQAQALETAAERPKFAPKKKKETQREALELYRVSLSLGHIEAQERIMELEKELG
jgi:chromosome segregation ATPase